MADLEKANGIVNRKRESGIKWTEDAAEKNNVMAKDVVWDTGATGAAAEFKLWYKMEEIFMNRQGGKATNSGRMP